MSELEDLWHSGRKPLLVDLYCCEGGAGMGYHRAGFEVIGVDRDPQPNYPFQFVQADVLELLASDRWDFYDRVVAFHASPPCQFATVYGNNAAHVRDDHPNLIPATRELLQATGLPYVIENVEGARSHLINPVRVCGTGLNWCRVRRHRYFEANWPIEGASCNHSRYFLRFFPGSSNRPNGRTVMNVGEYRVPLRLQRKVVKMPWASLYGISQAVPPAYTEHIGAQFFQFLRSEADLEVAA
jgi:DNA (cytosine-5)-methyltransferase 1